MQKLTTFIVDSFTDQPFKGNPAGVCLLDEELEKNTMFSIAKELGLSETAFVIKQTEPNQYSIRYFSPVMEIPLCGHATIASAKVIFNNSNIQEIYFKNIQGIDLHVTRNGELIKMEFPIYETIPADAPIELLKALGISSIVNCEYNSETSILLLEIKDCQELRNLEPNYEALVRSHNQINGVLVTSTSDHEEYDFESRYFWPWSGTNEDPATGGTHTFLAKYWSNRLSKKVLNSFQCSQRTGFMKVEIINAVKMSIESNAVILFEGVSMI